MNDLPLRSAADIGAVEDRFFIAQIRARRRHGHARGEDRL
jgi:hypothetical protein